MAELFLGRRLGAFWPPADVKSRSETFPFYSSQRFLFFSLKDDKVLIDPIAFFFQSNLDQNSTFVQIGLKIDFFLHGFFIAFSTGF